MSGSSNHRLSPGRIPRMVVRPHQSSDRDGPLATSTPPGSPLVGEPDAISTMFASGRTWGDFELLEQLGAGGMGVVFRARQISLGREVALKVLTSTNDEQQRARFRAEAKALARIESPAVVKVHLIGEHLGYPFFVMEYLRGRDLGALLEGGWRPAHAEAFSIVMQLAQGLAIASNNGLCHRDIQPANIMLTAAGAVKLMDFGLVGQIGEHETTISTSGGAISGTANYISPEQGSGLKADHRSDIYSLGIVFFQLLTGRLPFIGSSPLSLIYHHVHAEPPSPRKLDPRISVALEAVILRCLRKNPGQRYQSMRELIDALERCRRRQWRLAALRIAAGVLVALALLLGVRALWARHGQVRPPGDELALPGDPARTLPALTTVTGSGPAAPVGLGPSQHDALGWFVDLRLHGLSQRFRWCPPGSFMMGSPVSAPDHRKEEVLHRVTLSRGFWMADSECPQDLWRAVLGANPSIVVGPRLPVNYVSREDCHRFCNALDAACPGLAARLPWEAEWEYACRAGALTTTVSARTLSRAQACVDCEAPRAVGVSTPNPWGLRDMIGNVAEWCEDQYAAYPASPVTDPHPHASGDGIGRGGCWEDSLGDCNSFRRIKFWTDYPARDAGLRLVLDAPSDAVGP